MLPFSAAQAQTTAVTVTNNAGDQSAGSLGAAITTINSLSNGVTLQLNPSAPVTLSQPLATLSQAVTLEGNATTVLSQASTQSNLYSTAGINLDSGVSFAFGESVRTGGTASVTAPALTLGANSSFSVSGASGSGAGGDGASFSGSATVGANATLSILGGASTSGFLAGAANVNFNNLTVNGGNVLVQGGSGGAAPAVGYGTTNLTMTGGSVSVVAGNGSGSGGGAFTFGQTTTNLSAGARFTVLAGGDTGGGFVPSSLGTFSGAFTASGSTLLFGAGSTSGSNASGYNMSDFGSFTLSNSSLSGIAGNNTGSGAAGNFFWTLYAPVTLSNSSITLRGGDSASGTAGYCNLSFFTLPQSVQISGSTIALYGGNSANAGHAGGSPIFNMGITTASLTATNVLVQGGNNTNGGAGGSPQATFNGGAINSGSFTVLGGTGDGGNGGNASFNGGAVTLGAGATLSVSGGADDKNGIGGNASVSINNLTLNSGSLLTVAGGTGGGGYGTQTTLLPTLNGSGTVSLGTGAFQAQSGSFSGLIEGNVNLDKTGSGTLFLSGTNSYTGGTSVVAGILNISDTAALSTGTLTMAGGTLQAGADFDLANSVALSGANSTLDSGIYDERILSNINGSGGFTKAGVGTLVLDAVNTYTGPTTVSAGTLLIGDSSNPYASIQGSVNVGAAGTLGGYGSIAGAVANNGTLRPGVSGNPGTLTVASYTQGSGGNLIVDFAPNQGSLLKATGSAAIDGQVSINQTAGAWGFRYQYVFLSSSSLSGSFAVTAFNTLAGWNPTISQGSDALTLTLSRAASADFTQFAATANQTAVAQALNLHVNDATGAFLDKLNEIYIAGQGSALGSLSGQTYTVLPNVLLDGLQTQDALVLDRMDLGKPTLPGGLASAWVKPALSSDVTGGAGNAAGTNGPQAPGFWIQNTDSVGAVKAGQGLSGFNKSNYGFLGGYDGEIGLGLTGGIMGGYLHNDITASDASANTGVNSIECGLYGGGRLGGLRVAALAGYGWDHYKASRALAIGTDESQLAGAFDGSHLQADLEGSYPLQAGGFTLTPLAGLQYAHLSENAFTESGSGTLELDMPAQNYDSLRPFLGLDASQPMGLGGDLQLTPLAGLSVSDELITTQGRFAAALAAAPESPFTVVGASVSPVEFGVEGGLDLAAGKQFDLFLHYNGAFSDSQWLNNFNTGVNVAF